MCFAIQQWQQKAAAPSPLQLEHHVAHGAEARVAQPHHVALHACEGSTKQGGAQRVSECGGAQQAARLL